MPTKAELEIANQTLQTELNQCYQEQKLLQEELRKLHQTLALQAVPVAIAQLQERIVQLEQQLTECSSNQSILRATTAEVQSPCPTEPRLLEAIARVAQTLLTIEDFAAAVTSALQIIGESLETEHVAVIKNFDQPFEPFPCWQILYKWDSSHTASQLLHADAVQGRYEDVEQWYEQLVQRQGVSSALVEIPELFRLKLAAVGVKATHSTPIVVAGKFWGLLGFEECGKAKRWSPAQLSLLKIAANCIGSAIQRERSQQALLQAEQQRAAELAKAHEALKQTVDVLATETDLDRLLGHVLKVIADQLDAPLAEYWYHPEPDNIAYLGLTYWQGQILSPEEQPGHPGLSGYPVPPEMINQESLHHRRRHFVIEDMAANALHVRIANEYGLDAGAWYVPRGVKRELNVPLILGDRTIGALLVFLPANRYFTEQQVELTYALAQQVTLAIQLTRLAEEAKLAAITSEKEKAVTERAIELSKINEMLQAEIADRKRAEQVSRGQTEALVKTLTVLAAEPVLDNFLGYVLQAIAEQLGDRFGGIWLYDEAYDTTILHIDYEDGQIRRGSQITRPGASRQNVLRQWDADYLPLLRQKKILIQDIQDLPHSPAYALSQAYNQKQGIKTILVVSLFFGEKFLGNITLRSKTQRHYEPEELELACVLAHQASLAIQLTQLAEQAKQSAVLVERNRLAREIHDTLAQGLTGIVIQLQAAEDVDTTDPSDRQGHIAQARCLAEASLVEARRSVRALRPQALAETDLAGALMHLSNQMSKGTGLEPMCRVHGTPYPLLPEVESNLLRIAQEAFTNILKHAHASEVQLKLVYQPGQVELWVQDDGQGFDTKLLPTGGYGLIGMGERAQNIGAVLKITSQPGQGTEVAVAVPVLSASTEGSFA